MLFMEIVTEAKKQKPKTKIITVDGDEDEDVDDYTEEDEEEEDEDDEETEIDDGDNSDEEEPTDYTDEDDGEYEEDDLSDEESSDYTESEEEIELGDDDSDEEEPTDYTDEPTDDTSEGDSYDDSSDSSMDETEMSEEDVEQLYKNKMLLDDMINLKRIIDNFNKRLIDKNEIDISRSIIINQVITNNNIISKHLYNYIVLKFSKGEYDENLFFYNKSIETFNISIEMIEKLEKINHEK